MAIRIQNLVCDERRVIQQLDHYTVIEYQKDLSVAYDNVMTKYYMQKMGVTKKTINL